MKNINELKKDATFDLNDSQATGESQAIAVIGMGCRFPGGANSPDAFWEKLCEGFNAISEVPEERWNAKAFYSDDREQAAKIYTRYGGFLKDVDKFDAAFFGISPREADCVDPQHRLLLETSWEAMEDAGVRPSQLAGSKTGVYMGVFVRDYEGMAFKCNNRDLASMHSGVGGAMSIAANRLSYTFDLHGPSVTLDTACSSSMVALHLACQSLRNGESDLALAGGVNLHLQPEMTMAICKASMLSPDGQCKSFDASANGYVRSEGAGVVLLKPLQKALEDGDPIHVVIRATAVNQDGRSKGLTVPNGEAQAAALKTAYDSAGISAEDIQYVEAHGTGTAVGDPIEINALGEALFVDNRKQPTYVGSVKSNIGHTESAAGIAGLIKTAMAIKHAQIPPNLHFETANPQIDFQKLGLKVPQKLEVWPDTQGKPRMASINSFGFGGTNGHAVLSQAPVQKDIIEPVNSDEKMHILPMSARNAKALNAVAQQYAEFMETSGDELQDICFSAANARDHHAFRATVVADSKAAMKKQLDLYLADQTGIPVAISNQEHKLCFVFSGMGPQWWGMGQQLMEQDEVFRQTVEKCQTILNKYTEWSLKEEMAKSQDDSRIDETHIAQPAIFSLQVGLAASWAAKGIKPDVIIGHSVGEAAAAYVAGALSLDEAAKVIFHRSRLQKTTAGLGSMLAAALTEEKAKEIIKPYSETVSIGAINSRESVTLAGDTEHLEKIAADLSDKEIFNKFLRVEVPYHSPKMALIKDELLESLADIQPKKPTVKLFSTAVGKFIEGQDLDATYWYKNVRNPVLFADGVDALVEHGVNIFMEVGPHPVLASAISENTYQYEQAPNSAALILFSLRRNYPESSALLESLGQLYQRGYPIDWSVIETGKFTRLPHYPWQRKHFWIETEASEKDRLGLLSHRELKGDASHPLLGIKLNLAHQDSIWDAEFNEKNPVYLQHHKAQTSTVFPAAAYIEMAVASCRSVEKTNGEEKSEKEKNEKVTSLFETYSVQNLELRSAMFLDQENVHVQTLLSNDEFKISSQQADGRWQLHAKGSVYSDNQWRIENISRKELNEQAETFDKLLDKSDCYELFSASGLNYGEDFQSLQRLSCRGSEALGVISCVAADDDDYTVHPTVLDAAFQAMLATALNDNAIQEMLGDRMFLPVSIKRISVQHPVRGDVWAKVNLHGEVNNQLLGDVVLYDERGKALLEVSGLACAMIRQLQNPKANKANQSEKISAFYKSTWEEAKPVVSTTRVSGDETILIFSNQDALSDAIASHCIQNQISIIQVESSNRFAELGKNRYQIAPGSEKDINSLFETLEKQNNITKVLYMWGANSVNENDRFDQSLLSSTVLALVKCMAKQSTVPNLCMVGCQSRTLESDEHVDSIGIQQSVLWGMGQVINAEMPEIKCRGVDLNVDAFKEADQATVKHIMSELLSEDDERQIAYRGGQRYVARLSSLPAEQFSGQKISLGENGQYLITGGLGALGLKTAELLIRRGAKHIILTSRSGATGKEMQIAALTQLGAKVEVLAADVSNREDLEKVFEHINSLPLPLKGVIHAAGVIRDAAILKQTSENLWLVMAPKVAGTWYLHDLTKDMDLDFFVCYSSIASLFGSFGQINYAAGNAYMDALAHHRRQLGLPSVSINWGPWSGEGMAADLVDQLASRGLLAVENELGLDALESVLNGSTEPQIAVAPTDWSKFLTATDQLQNPFYENYHALAETDQQNLEFVNKLKSVSVAERQILLMDFIRGAVAAVLRLEDPSELTLQDSLISLGFDSLMTVEVKNRLDKGLGLSVAPSLYIDNPSTQDIYDHIFSRYFQDQENVADEAVIEDISNQLDTLTEEEILQLLENELAEA